LFTMIPRDTIFFDLFSQSAGVVHATALTYAELMRDIPHREDYIRRIRQAEHDNDEIVHKTLARLDTTFITPFDREDIHLLMKNMDDVIDEIDAAAKRLNIFKINEPNPWLIKQADLLVKATAHVVEAVKRLRNLKKPNGLQQTLVEIHLLENEGDENNHLALAELFSDGADPLTVMKWKELYDLTERAIDNCEDTANIIEAIVLKNT
jgi:uncharacterized protein Yka (UPF0111/DUF47 family)